MSPLFEWDRQKAERNVSNHAVSFEEAQTVFFDPFFAVMPDPDHSFDEHRFIAVGASERGRLLVVSYTERGTTIRIIMAGKATRRERQLYEQESR
jgi:uncharacterized DUF497 family protein